MEYLPYLLIGLLFVVGFICKIWLARHPEILERLQSEKRAAQKTNSALPYRARPSLLTPTEREFHAALYPLVRDHWHLYAKVRMEDIIEVQPGLERKAAYGYRSRIKSRHLDFILCDKESLEVLMCIELDDSSHQRRSRKEIDDFKDQAMAAAGITLTRVPVQASYSKEYLTGLFFEDDDTAEPAEPTPSQASEDPHARYRPTAATQQSME
jgi:hypothetical protein